MSILPLMDAVILFGWTSLVAGGLLKAVYVTTHYRPTVLGLTPIDFLGIAIVALLLALTQAARTMVKVAEPELLRRRRARAFSGAETSPWPEADPAPEGAVGMEPVRALEPAPFRAHEIRAHELRR
jgi:hypothetical protein